MPKRSPDHELIESSDHSASIPISELFAHINAVLNDRLSQSRDQRSIIGHNGEAGQIVENVLRDILRKTLPLRFGVAKGKIANSSGMMSRHQDIIIYDALNYPALFIDDNSNQILPAEGVFSVIEVKSSLSKSILEEAFDELHSVAIMNDGVSKSHNEKVDYFPPILHIVSLEDKRSLDTIHNNFVTLNKKYPQHFSGSCYSQKSPGSKNMTGQTFMVHGIVVANKGSVYHMLDGSTAIGRWGKSTIGLFISSLLAELAQIKLPAHSPYSYLSWLQAGAREIYRPSNES